MSLATMGRKSRTTNPRLRRQPCFVLNMTGRGNVIGRSFNAGQCRGFVVLDFLPIVANDIYIYCCRI